MEKTKIGFIGCAGLPNRYGGFEAFLESVAPVMVERVDEIYVTCDANKHEDRAEIYRGVKRIFLETPANGATSPIHDLLAFFKVVHKVDSIVVLGVSAGPFFLLMRLYAIFFGKKLLINIDGVEWRRDKFSKKVKFVLWAFDLCAQIAATKIIYDSKVLLPYVYPLFRRKAVCIPYSGDHVLRLPQLQSLDEKIAFTVCRIEPENNLDLLINGVLESDIQKYVIVGNWNNSEYGKKLRAKYAGQDRVSLLDPIYDPVAIAQYRESCHIYLHGHSVGGTNPSLVEMLFYSCHLACFDCSFNRETAGSDAYYFKDASELAEIINRSLLLNKKERNIQERYTATCIAGQYISAASIK